ncbi:hypothetical protein SynBMKMC1_01119 [Synechococcus sp. BMK-MC-1]|nr:hypothetical protein SynBMKMC1_01119 [Synechococcus sp. BMK-MC-1]
MRYDIRAQAVDSAYRRWKSTTSGCRPQDSVKQLWRPLWSMATIA